MPQGPGDLVPYPALQCLGAKEQLFLPPHNKTQRKENGPDAFGIILKMGRCSKFLCQKIPAWMPPATRSSLPQEAALPVLQRIPPSSEHQSQAPLTPPGPGSPSGQRPLRPTLPHSASSGSVPLDSSCPVLLLLFCKTGVIIMDLIACED